MEEKDKAGDSPMYLYGQVMAAQAMTLALADVTGLRAEFVQEATQAIERVRIGSEPQAVSDDYLLALDHAQAWLRAVG